MKWNAISRLLKAVINKVKSITKEKEIAVDPIQKLIENGNLILGEDCLLQAFTIFSHEYKQNFPNVTIGDGCHLMGQIELFSPDAKVTIGNRVSIGPNTKLFCREEITIGDDVMISWGCTLMDSNAHSLLSAERQSDVTDWKNGYQYKNWDVVASKPIHVQSKSWVGFNTIITKGVTLGEGTIVGCGSVVTKSTKSFSVVGGNPAVFIKDTL